VTKKTAITPKTKVGELLEDYPELEPVLMELAPAFKKLKNPVLRKTVGKIATLQQAAGVGNVSISVLINTLRAEIGQEVYEEQDGEGTINYAKPDWFDEARISKHFDATQIINAGENPMKEIFSQLDLTQHGGIFLLISPFVPAPIIELLSNKGFQHYCEKKEQDVFHTYIITKDAQTEKSG